MFESIEQKEINTEIVGAALFFTISAIYILSRFGLQHLFDSLFLWMFPASIMIFLSLLIVKMIKFFSRSKFRKPHKYLHLGPREV